MPSLSALDRNIAAARGIHPTNAKVAKISQQNADILRHRTFGYPLPRKRREISLFNWPLIAKTFIGWLTWHKR